MYLEKFPPTFGLAYVWSSIFLILGENSEAGWPEERPGGISGLDGCELLAHMDDQVFGHIVMQLEDHRPYALISVHGGRHRDPPNHLNHGPWLIGVDRPIKLFAPLFILYQLLLRRDSQLLGVLVVRTYAAFREILDTAQIVGGLFQDGVHVHIFQLVRLCFDWFGGAVEVLQIGAHFVVMGANAGGEVLVGLDGFVVLERFGDRVKDHTFILLACRIQDTFHHN